MVFHTRSQNHARIHRDQGPLSLRSGHDPRGLFGQGFAETVGLIVERGGAIPNVFGQDGRRGWANFDRIGIHGGARTRENDALDARCGIAGSQNVAGTLHGRFDQIRLRILRAHDKGRRRVKDDPTTLHGVGITALFQQVAGKESNASILIGLVVRQIHQILQPFRLGRIADGRVDRDAGLEQLLNQDAGHVARGARHEYGSGSVNGKRGGGGGGG
mmetsp:Transcript_4550/g.12647  ORF Transcript_4550/g.12647 Transcript_4550/m.12647 type:complete len:216 (-) Transcript_4550:4481-5128(-)